MASAQVEKREEEQQQGPSIAETVQDELEKLGFSKGEENEESGKTETSEVGTPLEDAKQALKEKYDTAKEAMQQDKSEAEDSKESGTGLDDAKAMLRDEYEDAKKSIQRNDGTPQGADALDTVKEKLEQGQHKTGDMVRSAEEKLENPDSGAPDESIKTVEGAKQEVGQKVDEATKQLSSDPNEDNKTKAFTAEEKLGKPDSGALDESIKPVEGAKQGVGQKVDEATKQLSSDPNEDNKTKAFTAEEKLGKPDSGAPDESIKTGAKQEVGQKVDEAKKQLSSDPNEDNETKAVNATKGPIGKITEAFKHAFSGSGNAK